ncbi:MAG: autotransporter assembly complex protein TamA [Sulfurifustis sp.]
MRYLHTNRRGGTLCVWLALMLFLAQIEVHAANLTVTVEGVSGAQRDNVLAALGIYQERDRNDLSPARIRALHERASAEIKTALQPFGYYRPRIAAHLEQDRSGWQARYDIDPGPAVPVTVIDLHVAGEGETDPEFVKLIDEFPIRKGDTLNHAVYEQAKQAFQRIAAERGYFDQAFVRHEVVVDVDDYHAEVHLHVDTGRRYRFGNIDLEQDILDPAFLARYVRIERGQPYSAAALLELQTTLSATDYYSTIEVVADPKQASGQEIPVHVRLTARKPSRYSFGFGYGTDTGPRGQLGWQWRYLNPQGHHVATELRASKIERTLNAGYFIPIRDPRTDKLAFTTSYTESDVRDIESTIRRLGVGRSTQRGRLQETLSLTLHDETFTIGESATGSSTLLIPGVTWSTFLGPERIYTRQGASAQLEVRGSSEQVASDVSMLQARFQSKVIFPFFDFGRFVLRGDVGATRIVDFDRLPPSLRFFAGGDVSVRGYAYNSLGPTDANGVVIGGKYLLVGSAEYQQRIVGNWAGAVFYDTGNALNDLNDPLRRGAGIGVRWRSPIGQIRLDLASALSNPGRPVRVHLYIGPDL